MHLSAVGGGLGIAAARKARLALVQDPGALVALGVVRGRAGADTDGGAADRARAGLLTGGDGATGRGGGGLGGSSSGGRDFGSSSSGGRDLGGRGRGSDRSTPNVEKASKS